MTRADRSNTTRLRPDQAWIRSSWAQAGVVLCALAVLGGTVYWARDQLRLQIREQIVSRDAVVLYSVTQMPGAGDDSLDTPTESLETLSGQFSLLLRSSKIRGVLGVRLYDARGAFVQAFPPNVLEGRLSDSDLIELVQLHPISRFHPHLPLDEVLLLLDTNPPPESAREPILEVNVPLVGIAQFMVEGSAIEREFETLDQHLNRQALTAFTVAGTLLALVIGLAFHRLRHAYHLVERRTSDLIQSQQEVVQTAKTSVVGAVTSHLIHELKNPLAGLHHLIQECARGSVPTDAQIWGDAASATRRMNTTIQHIVGLLREEQSAIRYEVSWKELATQIEQRLRPSADGKEVQLVVGTSGEGHLTNRTASLVALILVNLGENAIHATPASGRVTVQLTRTGNSGGTFRVSDEGPGYMGTQGDQLFMPKTSSREGGSGLGLAICKQLANYLGAHLELIGNTPSGCTFELTLPEQS
jgi:signal transduction histidine kinase